MNNIKVYIVLGTTEADSYERFGETWIVSVHKTREAAYAVCQSKEIAQLQEQLDAVQKQPSYLPELRHHWCVREHVLEI